MLKSVSVTTSLRLREDLRSRASRCCSSLCLCSGHDVTQDMPAICSIREAIYVCALAKCHSPLVHCISGILQ